MDQESQVCSQIHPFSLQGVPLLSCSAEPLQFPQKASSTSIHGLQSFWCQTGGLCLRGSVLSFSSSEPRSPQKSSLEGRVFEIEIEEHRGRK